jgi:BirA family biotin operon repressor/biotin-[acetyl-CoA-carboxylase] ligase
MARLGNATVRLDEAGSTNSLVLGKESYLDQDGLVVVARRQTAGRGRLGRMWTSLPGDQLFASVVVHPRTAAADTPAISLIAGLAVAEALADACAVDARLKWPNDVHVREKKVAGILVESKPSPRGVQRLVIGIGVNCQGSASDAPPELQSALTTLTQETGRLVSPDPVLQAILKRLEAHLDRLAGGHKAELLVAWARKAHVVGRRVGFALSDGRGEGIAQGITPEGYLVVEDVAGLRHILVSGEVRWRD